MTTSTTSARLLSALDPDNLLRFGNISIKKEDSYIKVTSEQSGGACGVFRKFDVQPNTVYEIMIEASVVSKGASGIWVSDNSDRTLIWKHNVFGLSMRQVRHAFHHKNVKYTNIGLLIKNPNKNDVFYIKQITFQPKIASTPYTTLQKPLFPLVSHPNSSGTLPRNFEIPPAISSPQPKPTYDPIAEMEKMSLDGWGTFDQTKTLPMSLRIAPNNQVIKSLEDAKKIAEEKARLAEEACRLAEQKSLEAHNARQLAEQRAKKQEEEKNSVEVGYLTLKKKLDSLEYSELVQQKTLEAEQAIQQAEERVKEAELAKKTTEEKARNKEKEATALLQLLQEERKRNEIEEKRLRQIQEEKKKRDEDVERLQRERLLVEQLVKKQEEERSQEKQNYSTLKKQLDEGVLEIARINKMIQEKDQHIQTALQHAEEKALQKERELALLRETFNISSIDEERKKKEEELERLEQRRLQMKKELQDMEEERLRRLEALQQTASASASASALPSSSVKTSNVSPPPLVEEEPNVVNTSMPDPNQLKVGVVEPTPTPTTVTIRAVPLGEALKRRILCCIAGNLNETSPATVLLNRWVRMMSKIVGTEIHVLSEYEISPEKTPLSDDVITNPNVKFFQPSQFQKVSLAEDKAWVTIANDLWKGYQYERVFLTSQYVVKYPEIASLWEKKMDVYFDGSFFDVSNLHTIEQVAQVQSSCYSFWFSSLAVLNKAKEDLHLESDARTVVFLPLIKQTIQIQKIPKINKANKIKMIFIGPLTKLYMIEECLSAYESVAPIVSNVEFHIFTTGNEEDKWTTKLIQKIKTTENVVYHGHEVVKNLHEYHFGLVFRSRLMDQDREIPEIIITFASYGVPCFVNGFSMVVRSFFGHEYNGYMTGPEDLSKKIFFYSRNRKMYEIDQLRCIRSAQFYTEASQLATITPLYTCGQ